MLPNSLKSNLTKQFNLKIFFRLVNLSVTSSHQAQKCNDLQCLADPLLISAGIVFNLIFMVIVFKNRRKPTSYFLMFSIVCDLVTLAYRLTTFVNTQMGVPDLSSRFKMCQLSTFILNCVDVLNLCTILAVDSILISLIRVKPHDSFIYDRPLVMVETVADDTHNETNQVHHTQPKVNTMRRKFFQIFSPINKNSASSLIQSLINSRYVGIIGIYL